MQLLSEAAQWIRVVSDISTVGIDDVSVALGVFAGACALIAGMVTFMSKWFLGPWVDTRIDAKIAEHEVNVRREMEGVKTMFVPAVEFREYVSEKNQKWQNQEKTNEEFISLASELRRDIKELIRMTASKNLSDD